MITTPSEFKIGDQVKVQGKFNPRIHHGVVTGLIRVTGHKCPTAEPTETWWPVIYQEDGIEAWRVPEIVTLLARR